MKRCMNSFPVMGRLVMAMSLTAVSLNALAIDARIPGVHVHYVGEVAVAKTAMDAMLMGCKTPRITGPSDKLGVVDLDVYYARDGAYMAKYETGHVAKPKGVCQVVIEPYSKILLYHFASRTKYEYATRGNKAPDWYSAPLAGNPATILMETMLGPKVGEVVATGKTGKYAGLACQMHELRTRSGVISERCQKALSPDAGAPAKLDLMLRGMHPETGLQQTYLQAESVDLAARIEATRFHPPAGVIKAKPGKPAIAPAMLKWCEKQFKATGSNPCLDDANDDED